MAPPTHGDTPPRLGDILVQQGLPPANLHVALRHQAVYGARLGTNLIELGLRDPDEVSRALAAQHQVPAALARHLASCDPRATQLLSDAVAAWFSVVPVGFAGSEQARRLVVCFRDPRDDNAVDAVSRATGLAIVACVAAECAVYRALESVYGVPFRRRVQSARDAHAVPIPESPSERLAAVRPPTPEATSGDRLDTAELDDARVLRAPIEVLPRPKRVSLSALIAPVLAPEEVMATSEEAIALLGAAANRQLVLEAILAYLRRTFGAGLVLVVRGESAFGESGCGGVLGDRALHAIEVDLSVPSMFRPPSLTRRAFRGTPPSAGASVHRPVFEWLGLAQPPAEAAVDAIVVRERVVCLIYAHMADGTPLTDLVMDELALIARQAGVALTRLILATRAPT